MKRLLIVITMLAITSVTAYSQGLYFDIGAGVGSATTKFDGHDFSKDVDSSVDEIGIGLGVRIGYGPIGNYPIYIVGDISGTGHRFEDDYNYVQFNTYLIGPGIIFYPIPLLHLGVSFGYSFVKNQTDLPIQFLDSKSGYAGSIYSAIDLGKGNHGCLLGVMYTKSINTLETTEAEQESSLFAVFIRYAYRRKITN